MANIERLQQGLRVLYEVRDLKKPFDIREWCYEDECGTTACALGWIALDPWHNSQGLHLNVYDQPTFEGIDLSPPLAAAQYFDISYNTASSFFMPWSYDHYLDEEGVKVEDVIERMEAFVKDIYLQPHFGGILGYVK